MSKQDELVATVVSGNTYTISPRYILKDSRILGKGSFGVVCTAFDSVKKIDMAIKRIRPYANDDWDARHTLREIRLMKLLGAHPNVITLHELSVFEPKTELYMMLELMDSDLHKVIQSKKPLSERHHKCFIKQILEGIKAMHAIGVFHRDLKPGNLLVSKDCQIRITDFGLARFMDETTRQGQNEINPMTEYVVTRWYRPPELLLAPNLPYTEAVDLWSIGCIFAELLRRKPLFPGKSHTNQVQLIFEVMGYSKGDDMGFPLSLESTTFMERHCLHQRQPLRGLVPECSAGALALLESLLTVNPTTRPTAAQASDDPFLVDAEVMHDYTKTYLSRPSPDFFEFENASVSVPDLKKLIEAEVTIGGNMTPTVSPSRPEEGHPASAQAITRPLSAGPSPQHTAPTSNSSNNNLLEGMGGAGARTDGPPSQLPTQKRGDNSEAQNPFMNRNFNQRK